MPSQNYLQTTRLVKCCQNMCFGDHVRMGPKSQFDPGVFPHAITNKIPFCGVHIVGNDIGQVHSDVSSPGRGLSGRVLDSRQRPRV